MSSSNILTSSDSHLLSKPQPSPTCINGQSIFQTQIPKELRSSRSNRSLLDRRSFQMALLPKDSAKKNISFSPVGYYTDTTDIMEIHKYVENYFQTRSQNIPKIDKDIESLKHRFQAEKLKVVDRNALKTKIRVLQKRKENLQSDRNYHEYLERSGPIIEEWNNIRGDTQIRFGEEKQFCPDKLSLVRTYIQIASEYAPLDLTFKSNGQNKVCPYCRKPYVIEGEGHIICYECDTYQDILTNDVTYSDISRINGASNNNYKNLANFIRAMDNYQGKGKVELPDDLFEKFNEYCQFNHIVKSHLTLETTLPIFKRIGYPQYYENINLFLFIAISRPLHDISEYEAILLQDYNLYAQEYELIKGEERSSALNSWYVLYILMRRRGIPCQRCDFKIPDTPSINRDNDRLARKAFERLKWDFDDTI